MSPEKRILLNSVYSMVQPQLGQVQLKTVQVETRPQLSFRFPITSHLLSVNENEYIVYQSCAGQRCLFEIIPLERSERFWCTEMEGAKFKFKGGGATFQCLRFSETSQLENFECSVMTEQKNRSTPSTVESIIFMRFKWIGGPHF